MYKWICSFIHPYSLVLKAQGHCDLLESIPAFIKQRQRDALDKSPAHHKATWRQTPPDNSQLLILYAVCVQQTNNKQTNKQQTGHWLLMQVFWMKQISNWFSQPAEVNRCRKVRHRRTRVNTHPPTEVLLCFYLTTIQRSKQREDDTHPIQWSGSLAQTDCTPRRH